MAKFIVRVYSPWDDSVIDHPVEAESVEEAREKILGVKLVSLFTLEEFEVEKEFIVTVYTAPVVVVVPEVRVSLKYEEFVFRDFLEADAFAKRIEERAVGEPTGYIFMYGGRMIRARVYRSPDPRITRTVELNYWIVKRPIRVRSLKIWKIAIPGFAVCAMLDDRRAKHIFLVPEGFKLNGYEVTERVLQVCDYHSGQEVTRVPVLDKIFDVPDAVCAFYCPQGLHYRAWNEVTEKEEWHAYCRAYMPVMSDFEARKRSRKYRGMNYLCIDDRFWRWWWTKGRGRSE